MLPRISEALSKFLTPITRSETKTASDIKKNEEFQRVKIPKISQESKNPQKKQSKAKLKLVPSPKKELEVPATPSTAQAMIQLISSFQETKQAVSAEVGAQTYETNQKQQKKAA